MALIEVYSELGVVMLGEKGGQLSIIIKSMQRFLIFDLCYNLD